MLKNILKIVGLYIIFGITISVVISLTGAYNGLVVLGTMGNVTIKEYISLMGYTALLWKPIAIMLLFSASEYLKFKYHKIIIATILLAFALGITGVLKQRK